MIQADSSIIVMSKGGYVFTYPSLLIRKKIFPRSLSLETLPEVPLSDSDKEFTLSNSRCKETRKTSTRIFRLCSEKWTFPAKISYLPQWRTEDGVKGGKCFLPRAKKVKMAPL
jgi:hypothetical protein